MPNDDGEFYQFCYVTHKGEIRGASTPFLFRAQSPSEDELLTVEDECNSDILVVTTRTGYLEVCQREREQGSATIHTRTRMNTHTHTPQCFLFVPAAKDGGGPQREGGAGSDHEPPAE